MYELASKIQHIPILSLQTGEVAGWTRRPMIELATLEIIAFYCEKKQNRQALILLSRDIRQFAPDCIIVDSEEELTNPDDIIRLKSSRKANFNPLDKPVISDAGRKLGQVEDYSINLETCRIQKLYVRGSLFRLWPGPQLTIDRTQIIDVTPHQIVVRDSLAKAPTLPVEAVPD